MTIPDGQYISQKDADVFEAYAPDYDNGVLFEVGTGKGHSASFWSKLLPTWTIYTIDGYGLHGGEDGRIFDEWDFSENIKNTSNFLKDSKNVVTILGDSGLIPWNIKIDILFIDGDHSYVGVKRDFYNFEKFVTSNGIVIFHDYWNPEYGVGEFVNELIQKGVWKLLHGHRMAVIQRR